MSAIVTNSRSRVAYNIVRNLGEKGISVYTGDTDHLSMSFVSRYSKAHFVYPSPFSRQEAFINCIIANITKLKADVLIPVSEETFLISKFKYRFENLINMVVPDYPQILFAHNKDRWLPVARHLGIPVPETYDVEKMRNDNLNLQELRFPVLIKPKQGGGGWQIRQINSLKQLQETLKKNEYNDLPWERFILQEKIGGATHCVAMLFRHGEERAKVTYKQLREYPANTGQATLRVSIRNHKAERALHKMLTYLKWHGICQADFIVDRNTEIPYLIDINPRFWGSLAQGIASGVDFPYLLYRMAIDGDVDKLDHFRTGVTTQWIGGDLRALFRSAGNRRAKPLSENGSFCDVKQKISYDDFIIRDPLPFILWLINVLHRMIRHKSLSPPSDDFLASIWR